MISRICTVVIFLITGHLIAQNNLIAVDSLFAKELYSDAENQLRMHLSSYPNDLNALEQLGDAYGYQEKWDEASKIYKELIDYIPDRANLHYKLGGSLGMKAQSVSKISALMFIGEIKESLEEAIRLDPTHIEAHWAIIEYYIALPGIIGGSSEIALEYANKLEQFSAVDGYLAKGYIYEYDDEPQLAELNYLKAVDVGGSIVCYNELTDFYLNIKQPEKAIEIIKQAQKSHDRNALHYQLGKVSADYNVQLDRGLRCISKYINDYSVKDGVPLEWAYYRRAQIYKHKKNKERALQDIQRALSLRTDFPQAIREEKIILQL